MIAHQNPEMQISKPHFRISRRWGPGICSSNAVLTTRMSNQVWKQLVKVRGEELTQLTGQVQVSGGGRASGEPGSLGRSRLFCGGSATWQARGQAGQTGGGGAVRVGKGAGTEVTRTHQRQQK